MSIQETLHVWQRSVAALGKTFEAELKNKGLKKGNVLNFPDGSAYELSFVLIYSEYHIVMYGHRQLVRGGFSKREFKVPFPRGAWVSGCVEGGFENLEKLAEST